MLLIGLASVVALLTPPGPDSSGASAAAYYLQRVVAKTPATLARVSEKDMAGTWSHGGPFGGSHLYLFEDHTYIYTEWADILRETIYDRGTWRARSGMLALAPGPSVTWTPASDRRYLIVQPPGGRVLLLGVDFGLAPFVCLSAKEPSKAPTWLEVAAHGPRKPWRKGEAARVRARLAKESWRPCFFAKEGCPRPDVGCDPRAAEQENGADGRRHD